MIAWAKVDRNVLLWWQDECWFSRFAQPNAHDWGGVHLVEREVPRNEPHKAIACYGAVRADTGAMHLAFCPGQPKSDYTLAFLPQLLDIGRNEGKRVVIVVWDHASWHKSKCVRQWIRAHNQQAKLNGDVRLIVWLLPKKSPWLNPIEAHWVHGKRAVLEPGNDTLTVPILRQRLCDHFQVTSTDLISSTQ